MSWKISPVYHAKVGSVDKFQGQEDPIVFLSMCASNANESAGGMKFLFDKNRINVAVSRAQCMTIVTYSPSLLETTVSNTEQLGMVNLFCRLVETIEWILNIYSVWFIYLITIKLSDKVVIIYL